MDSPNSLHLTLPFAGHPVTLRMGYDDFHLRNTWEVGRHCNADFEVHILLSGHCTLEIDRQNILFDTSSAVLIAPGIFHYSHRLSQDFERFSFSFISSSQDFTQALREQIQTSAICQLPPYAISLCRSILDEMSADSTFHEDAIRALITYLLVFLFRGMDLDLDICSEPTGTAIADTTTWRTSIIDAFFSPWPNSFGTEDELAAMLHLSRRQLNRVLLQTYGIGYRQKMLRARMEYAGNLLLTTDQTARQIGVLVGYTAESSFYKAFQRYYNMTPQQYRDTKHNCP